MSVCIYMYVIYMLYIYMLYICNLEPGHSFNQHAKFTLVEQLSNIYTTNISYLRKG